MAFNTLTDFYRGKTLKQIKQHGNRTIEWKQGSFVGFGGNMSEVYQLWSYEIEKDTVFPVFVHESMGSAPKALYLDGRVQFGVTKDTMFFVLHPKDKYKPYQSRFIMSEQDAAWFGGQKSILKQLGIPIDFTWMKGEYLETL